MTATLSTGDLPRATRLRRKRSALLLGCAAGVAVAAPGAAFGQAFQGNPTVDSGSVVFNRNTPGVETIIVETPTATVNWDPFDSSGTGPIDFLPNGHTATFTNNPSTTPDFIILNRIIPTDASRPVAFNGTVISQLQTASGAVTGGKVAFYSPGGIIVGSSAVFDVGSLLLTTLDPVRDGSGNFFGASGNITLVGAAGSTSLIDVQAGAQISALAEGSYVGILAPRIQMNGDVRVNGSAAYVAAEAADITIQDGLFDINILTGTEAGGFVLTHGGSTTGPASTGGSDNHRIYMVAVPKNQAITALLTGTDVGFDTATSATVENGEIILSAGYNVAGDAIAANPVNSVEANFHIVGGTYSSDLTARATSDLFAVAAPSTTSPIAFTQDVTLIGGRNSHLAARSGNTVTVGGDAIVSNGFSDSLGGRASTGTLALIYADAGSSLTIGGDATVDASVRGLDGGDATGGEGRIHAFDGGTISVGGDVRVDASGLGGGTATGDDGTSGTGGTAELLATSGGTITVGGNAELVSTGLAGIGQNPGGTTGDGIGGDAGFSAFGAGSAIDIGGNAFAFANGLGGVMFVDGAGGTGQGGFAFAQTGSGGTIAAGPTMILAASGSGGAGTGTNVTGGDGLGGRALLSAFQGDISVAGFVSASAIGEGADGNGTGNGGDGTGGIAQVFAGGADISFGSAELTTDGIGGDGAAGGFGRGGSGPVTDETPPSGGSFLSVRDGSITGSSLTATSNGTGGAGTTGAGGNALGGISSVTALNGTTTATIDIDSVTVNSSAVGGDGGTGAAGGIGEGGEAYIIARAQNGAVFVDTATIEATGTGGAGGGNPSGAGGAGGAGYGGFTNFGTATGTITSSARDGIATFGTASADVSATGGAGGDGSTAGGAGGVGIGGGATLLARGSRLDADTVTITINGTGGLGGLAGTTRAAAGPGIGGSGGLLATVEFMGTNPSDVDVGTFSVVASGVPAEAGAPTQAGRLFLEVIGSSATLGTVTMVSEGAALRDFSGTDSLGQPFTLTNDPSQVRVEDGTLTVTGDADIAAANELILDAIGNATFEVGGDLTVSSSLSSLEFSAEGAGRHIVGGTLTASANLEDGDVSIEHTTSETDPTIPAGALTVSAAAIVFSGHDIDTSQGVAQAATTIDFTARDDLTVGDLSAGTSIALRQAADADFTDPEEDFEFTIAGAVVAPTITLESVDLDIVGDGQLGEAGVTQTLNLVARTNGLPVILGGTEPAPEGGIRPYQIAQFEADLIEAANITLTAGKIGEAADRGPDVIVRDLAISGTQDGGAASVALLTPGVVQVEGDLLYSAAAASDRLTIDAAEGIVVTPDGSIVMTSSGTSLSGILSLTSDGAFAAASGSRVAAGTVAIDAATVDTGAVEAANALTLASAGDLTLTGPLSAPQLTISSPGALTATGPLSGNDVNLDAETALTLGQVTATNTITLASGTTMALNGNVTAPTVTATAGSSLTTGTGVAISGTTITLTAGTDLSVGNVTAAQRATFSAGGNATFRGAASAPTISVTSADIDIQEGALLGDAEEPGTLNLTARPTGQQVVLGGSTEGPGYTLTQAEAARIEAQTITFTAPRISQQSNGTPDVLVRDLTIIGSQDGGTESVTLTTPGHVRVEGLLAYTDAAATDTLTIRATDRLEVITPSGGIGIVDENGVVSGRLTLASANIVVTMLQLAQQLAADPNFAGRDQALATNTGPVDQGGRIQAGGVALLSGGNIFVQNTGTSNNFAGITTGGDGLLIGRISEGGGGVGSDGTSFSFVGTLTTADEVLFFDFTINAQSEVTLRTYSYAGGTNAVGTEIPAGGFDPILSLYDAAGARIAQNDDGGSNVPADPTTGLNYDTFLQQTLQAGSYRVAVSVFPNFGPADLNTGTFPGASSFGSRSPNFAFDVLGANSSTGPGGGGGSGSSDPLNVVAFGRMRNADGSFSTGRDFFDVVNFGTGGEAPITYTAGSTFNGFSIGNPGPVLPPVTTPVAPASVVLGGVEAAQESVASDDEGGPGGRFGAGFVGLIDTNALANEALIEEPVASGGDSSLWTDGEDDEDEDEDDAPAASGDVRSDGDQ